jgi:hypothetical protein
MAAPLPAQLPDFFLGGGGGNDKSLGVLPTLALRNLEVKDNLQGSLS